MSGLSEDVVYQIETPVSIRCVFCVVQSKSSDEVVTLFSAGHTRARWSPLPGTRSTATASWSTIPRNLRLGKTFCKCTSSDGTDLIYFSLLTLTRTHTHSR